MSIMRLGYVHIRVTDLDDATKHYTNTLGMTQTAEVGRMECGVVLVWQSWHEIRCSWGEASYDATTAGKLVLWHEVHCAVR